MKSGSDFSDDEIFHLPQVTNMPIAVSSHVHKVTFRSPVVRPVSESLTPNLVPQPISFNLSGIPNTETSGKDTDSEADGRPNLGTRSGLTPHQKGKRMRQDGFHHIAQPTTHG